MDDREIVALFLARSESAISAAEEKYEKYCYSIAYQILGNHEDAMECVNDTYLRAWNSIPPAHPDSLAAFLGKICRNLSIDRYDQNRAIKRGGMQTALAFEELEMCIAAGQDPAESAELQALTGLVNSFLFDQPEQKRNIFLRRYLWLHSIKEIAEFYGVSETKIKSVLFRMRKKLAKLLQEEGYYL